MNGLKIICVTLVIAMSMLSGCSNAQVLVPQQPEKVQDKRILILYLSRTKNTKAIAEMIHGYTGGKLVSLEIKDPYPENYQATVDQVERENASGFLPALKTQIDNIEQYDIVFIGFPTWGMQLPPPVKSFLTQYKLDGKTVIPFNTNAGYGLGTSFQTVNSLCRNSNVLEGFSVKGGIERDGVMFVMEGEKEREAKALVEQWLIRVKILEI